MRYIWALLIILTLPSYARDLGQWKNQDPEISAWYKALRMPDTPTLPCCGEGDAYYADIAETGPNGELIAVVTDDRDDAPLQRPHIPVGTRIVIPEYKIKWDQGNPTGHIVLFVGYHGENTYLVYCYVQNGGV